MEISEQARARLNQRLAWKELGEEVVILDLESGAYYGLNATASRLWQHLAGGDTLGQALDKLCTEFAVERGQAATDAQELLAELGSTGLITMVDEAAGAQAD